MTILEVLSEDHQEVSLQLKTIAKTRSVKSREKHFVEMKQSLEIHAFLEQLIFYKALFEVQENREIIQRSEEEHELITELLAVLDSLPKDEEEWMPKFRILKEAIEAHVKKEEGEIYDRARKTLSADQLTKLGAEMATKKAEQLAVQ